MCAVETTFQDDVDFQADNLVRHLICKTEFLYKIEGYTSPLIR